MNTNNQRRILKQLIEKFKETDKLHQDFHAHFNIAFNKLNKHHKGIISEYPELHEDLKSFCYSIINSITEIIEKDKLKDRAEILSKIDSMDILLLNSPTQTQHTEFTEAFTKLIQKDIVDFFPDVFNLSADGLRTIDKASKFYTNIFLEHLYAKSNN